MFYNFRNNKKSGVNMSDIFKDIPKVSYTSTANTQTTAENKPQVENKTAVQVKDALPASKVQEKADTVEISTKDGKKGPIKGLKGFIANIKKFFATTSAYTKGVFKGLATGAVAGSIVYTAGSAINFFKTHAAQAAAKKAGEELTKVKKLPNKVLAFAVAGIALVANIWNASLNATEANSQIDHRWTGHKK